MRLYHGSNCVIMQPDLSCCRQNKDFGQGFYLTSDLEGAENMAKRTGKREGGTPHVMVFKFDESRVTSGIAVKRFDGPTVPWALFVMANRRPHNPAEDHNRDGRYGLVVGPIANDDLALLFRQFEKNLVTVEMLVHEMQYKKLMIQYSFHTVETLQALTLVEVRDVR